MQEATTVKSHDSRLQPQGATLEPRDSAGASQTSIRCLPPGVILARFFSTTSRRAAAVLGFTIPISTAATEAVLAFLVVCWLLSGDYAIRFQMIRRSRVAMLSLVMFGAYAIGTMYTSASLAEAMDTLLTYRKLLYVPILITLFAHSETRRYSIYAFVLAMLVTLGASFLMSWGLLEPHWVGGSPTDCAFFKNHIAQNISMALFIAVLVSRGCPKSRLRWLYFGVILLALYNIFFMVAGRTGYVILFALVFLWLYRSKGFRGLALAAVVLSCLVPAIYFCSSGFRGRVNSAAKEAMDYYQGRADFRHSSTGQRLLLYETALRVASHSPLIGRGTGSFRTEFAKTPARRKMAPSNNHNEYLSILVQTGLIGLSLFLWWIWAQWNCSQQLRPDLASLAQAIIVAVVVACFFNSIISSTTEGWIYCYFISLCCGSLFEAPPAAQPFPSNSRLVRWIGIAG